MAYLALTRTDIASDLFWPQLDDMMAELWGLAGLPANTRLTFPRYDRDDATRLKKFNATMAALWTALGLSNPPTIRKYYFSQSARLKAYNAALVSAYTAAGGGGGGAGAIPNLDFNSSNPFNSQYLAILEEAA